MYLARPSYIVGTDGRDEESSKMSQSHMKALQLYLPLLAHHQHAVRQQACLIVLGTYGDRALTYLRRMTDDSDYEVRQSARLALLAMTEMTNQAIKVQSFRGMYIECLGRLRVYIGNHEIQHQDWAQS